MDNKRLYEVRVIVSEEKIYHIYADDEADLTSIWNKDNFVEEKPKEPTQLELDLKPKLNVIKNEDKESD